MNNIAENKSTITTIILIYNFKHDTTDDWIAGNVTYIVAQHAPSQADLRTSCAAEL